MDLRMKHRSHPIVMHIMPTERCNLKCEFCSVAHREALPDLPFDIAAEALLAMHDRGLKAVILSGGGDPTLYPQINDLLELIYDMGIEAGMITNGVALATKIRMDYINRLKWLRISANTLDYLEDIAVPDLASSNVTVGFSYIWNPKSDTRWPYVQRKITGFRKNIKIAYVRLLPDCNLPTHELESAHRFLRNLAEDLGAPYFHQYKNHKTPPECHLGRVHPVLYTDQMVYPCDSLVLNSPEDDKKFHRDYALCHVNDIATFYDRPIVGSLIDTQRLCPRCVFDRQNRLLMDIIHGADEPSNIHTNRFQHVNFI